MTRELLRERSYLLNCWYVAAIASEVTKGQPLFAKVAGQPLTLYRDSVGTVLAFDDNCPHRQASLSLGKVEGDNIRCMYHGLLFDKIGQCVAIPGQDRIPPEMKLRKFPAVERGGWIWVWPGSADSQRLPPALPADDPQWVTRFGFLDYKANHTLLINNLLDFSHVSYVHVGSFVAGPEWAAVKPVVKTIEDGLFISRWLVNAPAIAPAGEYAGKPVDMWQGYSFTVPGILLMNTIYCKPGTAARSGEDGPTEGNLVHFPGSQAVTAIDEHTSRYFFATSAKAADKGDEAVERNLQIASEAFEEDRATIETQQRRIDERPDFTVIPTAADVAITRFDAILRRARMYDGE